MNKYIIMALSLMLSASAYALDSCKVGQRVKAPGGNGVVTEIRGSSCVVRKDGNSFTDVYADFMLDPIDDGSTKSTSVATSQAKLKNGTYQCYYLAGSTLNYGFVDIVIKGNDSYKDGKGNSGTFQKNGRNIKFLNGPYVKHKAVIESSESITLTTPGGSFGMSCSLKK